MKNNKGFSLVELIIVIAIMAILVGVMAPQLIKYIEKTNVSSDVQLCDTVKSALTTASMDPEVVVKGGYVDSGSTVSSACKGSLTADVVADILGVSKATMDSDLKAKLKSKNAKNHDIQVTVKNSNQIIVYVDSSIKVGD